MTLVRDNRTVEVCLTGLASDAHTWNLVFVQLLLEEYGCVVTNLGPCVPGDEVVSHCLTERPDLLVVSTVNGHGVQDGGDLIRRLRSRPGTAALPAVIGGKIGVGGADPAAREALLAAGFDAVFDDGADLTAFASLVRQLTTGAGRGQ